LTFIKGLKSQAAIGPRAYAVNLFVYERALLRNYIIAEFVDLSRVGARGRPAKKRNFPAFCGILLTAGRS